tara:strand:+ start:150 stop:815 length:666 start_codon:yes stop_codon:yes gene_type:complete
MFSRSRNRKNSADSDESKSSRSPTEGRSAFGRKGKAKEEGASKEAADTVSALPTESTSPVSAGSKAPPKLDRKFSTLSQQTVDTLETLEAQIKVMSVSADDAEKARAAAASPVTASPLPTSLTNTRLSIQEVATASAGAGELRPDLRNELAQLHGNANKLLATKLDAILTGELNSGKDEARAKRKQLIGVTETLIDRVEGLVKAYDQTRENLGSSSKAAST